MLTCYGHSCRLPQGELTYLAFRLAALDTFEEILTCKDSGERPDATAGFMVYVPILAEVPVAVYPTNPAAKPLRSIASLDPSSTVAKCIFL